MNKTVVFRVAGVSFDGRQSIIAKLRGDEPCRIQPEPTNKYDPNALAVLVATSDGVKHCGFIPRDVAARVAPFLEGEPVQAKIVEILGGFELSDGDTAAYGLRVAVTMPLPEDIFRTIPIGDGYRGELPER